MTSTDPSDQRSVSPTSHCSRHKPGGRTAPESADRQRQHHVEAMRDERERSWMMAIATTKPCADQRRRTNPLDANKASTVVLNLHWSLGTYAFIKGSGMRPLCCRWPVLVRARQFSQTKSRHGGNAGLELKGKISDATIAALRPPRARHQGAPRAIVSSSNTGRRITARCQPTQPLETPCLNIKTT